jgi:hypothetical protein
MHKMLVLSVAFLAFYLAPGRDAGADIPAELQVELQSVMLNYMDQIAPDGAYRYVDTETNTLRTVYPANIHPFVIQAGDDYFVCAELIDEDGNNLTADFLVREIEGAFRVVQLVIGDRAAIQAIMANIRQ